MRAVAMRASFALDIQRRCFVLRAERLPARAAQPVAAGFEAMAHRYTLVEHKTLAVPAAGFSRYGFQVFQTAALLVVDLVATLGAQEGSGFLAANAAGVKQIGRASCRERVCQHVWSSVGAVSYKKKKK